MLSKYILQSIKQQSNQISLIRSAQSYNLRLFSSKPKKIVEQVKKIPEKAEKQAYKDIENDIDANPLKSFWDLKINEIQQKPELYKTLEVEEQPERNENREKGSDQQQNEELNEKQIDFEALNCTGCGIKLQYEHSDQLGFAPMHKVLTHFKKQNELSQMEKDLNSVQSKNKQDKNIIDQLKKMHVSQEVIDELERVQNSEIFGQAEILDVNALLQLDQLANQHEEDPLIRNYGEIMNKQKQFRQLEQKPNNLICQRCYELKHLNKLNEYQGPPSKYAGSPVALANHVQSMNRQEILNKILERIYNRSIIIMVIDIVNFEGSQIDEIFEQVNKKKHRLLIVVNKIDALPSVNVDRIQQWVKNQIKHKLSDDIVFNICLTSAKMATGIEKVVDILEKVKKDFAKTAYLPKIYVVGCTNSGKSSFINSLIFKSNKYKDSNKVLYRGKFDILTESPAPGTTLEMVSVDDVRLGYKIFDTPGIPNLTMISSLIKDYQDLITTLPNKKISSFPMNVKSTYSIWLGALARVDFLSGDDKYFTFYVPPNVTIHRTPLLKADDVYSRQAGILLRPTYHERPEDVVFEKHEIGLNCNDFRLANFDISIEGLGWFSIQGKGFMNLLLNLPKGVKYHIRKEPLMPFEVMDKGLKRYTGNPVNSYSKKNKELATKFKAKREKSLNSHKSQLN